MNAALPAAADKPRGNLEGFRRYGKGRHPAALNLGDCATYALAAARAEPVLCTGDDFRRTNLDVVDLGA